jgi:hypothetical protein
MITNNDDLIQRMRALPAELQAQIIEIHRQMKIYEWWNQLHAILSPTMLVPREWSRIHQGRNWEQIIDTFLKEITPDKQVAVNEVNAFTRFVFLWNINHIHNCVSVNAYDHVKYHFFKYKTINDNFRFLFCFGGQLIIKHKGYEISPNIHNIREYLRARPEDYIAINN